MPKPQKCQCEPAPHTLLRPSATPRQIDAVWHRALGLSATELKPMLSPQNAVPVLTFASVLALALALALAYVRLRFWLWLRLLPLGKLTRCCIGFSV